MSTSADQKRAPLTATTLRKKALSFLARREYAQTELMRKLMAYSDEATVREVVESLGRDHLQSDERYGQARAHVLARKFGRGKIRHELKKSGMSEADINHTLQSLATEEGTAEDEESAELARAQTVLRKKSPHPPHNAQEKARLIRFLQARGFSWAIINAALKSALEDENEG